MANSFPWHPFLDGSDLPIDQLQCRWIDRHLIDPFSAEESMIGLTDQSSDVPRDII